jgi:dTDP-glucose pyrophosphorylase
MKLIISMAGQGARFVREGYTAPKPAIAVDGYPMFVHALHAVAAAPDSVVFITQQAHLAVLGPLIAYWAPGSTVITLDARTHGPVESLLAARLEDVIGAQEPVIVAYCDFGGLVAMPLDGVGSAVAAYRGFHPHHKLAGDRYGYAAVSAAGLVVAIKEKASWTENPLAEYASNGVYYFRQFAVLQAALAALVADPDARVNGEYFVSGAINEAIRAGEPVRIVPAPFMKQLGTPRDLKEYQQYSNLFRYAARRPRPLRATCLLAMAGRGSRFATEGYTLPKPLLPVSGKPMWQAALTDMPVCDGGVRLATLAGTSLGGGPRPPVLELSEVTDGQATTVLKLLDHFGLPDDEPLLVTPCDSSARYNPKAFEALVQGGDADVIVWCFADHPSLAAYPHWYAWLDVADGGAIREVSCKKPFAEPARNRAAIIGTMYFRSAGLYRQAYQASTERTNGEYYVDNLLNTLILAGARVVAFPVWQYVCWGTPHDYESYGYWERYFRGLIRRLPALIAHRVNTLEALAALPDAFGAEVDVQPDLRLAHDWGASPPSGTDSPAEPSLRAFLERWIERPRGTLVLNMKCTGQEGKVLDLCAEFGVTDFFFLDCAFPVIHYWVTKHGITKFALRLSNYEPLPALWTEWVWADCFDGVYPPAAALWALRTEGRKICRVAPELQGLRPAGLPEMLECCDALCTKHILP